jgi:hypothetical protein
MQPGAAATAGDDTAAELCMAAEQVECAKKLPEGVEFGALWFCNCKEPTSWRHLLTPCLSTSICSPVCSSNAALTLRAPRMLSLLPAVWHPLRHLCQQHTRSAEECNRQWCQAACGDFKPHRCRHTTAQLPAAASLKHCPFQGKQQAQCKLTNGIQPSKRNAGWPWVFTSGNESRSTVCGGHPDSCASAMPLTLPLLLLLLLCWMLPGLCLQL